MLKINRLPLRAGVLAIAMAVLVMDPTWGQDDAVLLEELVVTARKLEESIADVPLSITAFMANRSSTKGSAELGRGRSVWGQSAAS